jgi:hypothetical protein
VGVGRLHALRDLLPEGVVGVDDVTLLRFDRIAKPDLLVVRGRDVADDDQPHDENDQHDGHDRHRLLRDLHRPPFHP